MTNSSSSTYPQDEIGTSTGLLEILKAISLIVAISEEHTHHILHSIHGHLFHGKDVHEHINHKEVLDFLHGLHLIMEEEHITKLSELDHYIHESKHAFEGKIICKVE